MTLLYTVHFTYIPLIHFACEQVLSVPKEAPKSFVLEGTALGSPAKPDVTVLAVPALSPTDSRYSVDVCIDVLLVCVYLVFAVV